MQISFSHIFYILSPQKHTFDIISMWLLCVQRWGANEVGKSKCDGVEIVQKFNGN